MINPSDQGSLLQKPWYYLIKGEGQLMNDKTFSQRGGSHHDVVLCQFSMLS